MNFIVGMLTCNRLDFTKKVVKSVLHYMPELKKYPWVIADDHSTDKTVEWLKGLNLDMHILMDPIKQRGALLNTHKLYVYAEKRLNAELAMLLTNDFFCTRRVNISDIIKFFEERPIAGQVQMFHYKGRAHKKERERSKVNWRTWKPIVGSGTFRAGKEKLHRANWNFTQAVNFTRMNTGVDYFEGMLGEKPAKGEYNEAHMDENFQKTGLEIYEMAHQPFWHLDHDGKGSTKRVKR